MPEREDAHTHHGEERLIASFVKSQRASHNSETECADCDREDEAMIVGAAAKRNRAKHHGKGQPDLMNDRLPKKPARRCDQTQEDRRRQAMDEAQARKPDGELVQPPLSCQ